VIKPRNVSQWILLTCIALVGAGGLAWGVWRMTRRTPPPMVMAGPNVPVPQPDPDPDDDPEADMRVPVKIIHPAKGLMKRLSTQPGSVQAYESVRLFAKVPGFLKWQHVLTDKGELRPLDIGDRVKKGQKLAVVDVPELEAQMRRNKAAVKQAESRVDQMKARVTSAEADLEAAKAAVTSAEASHRSAQAWVRYQTLEHGRYVYLIKKDAIERRLLDESKEHLEAYIESEIKAKEAIAANEAKVVACRARIKETEADVKVAQAEVEVAEAEYERVRVQVAFATVVAPFDGVITHRRFVLNDYIRSANEAGNEPMLTVDRTDMFRVIVQIPDRDVPATHKGEAAFVYIDALPRAKLPGTVSRVSDVEDPLTRLMHVEIDLPNPTGKIRKGMYGQVTIVLDPQKDLYSIPASCVQRRSEDGTGTIFVVRDGHAHRLSVRLGVSDGVRVPVLDRLTHEHEVILQPAGISEGTEVIPTVAD
jgi:RND family efflux transporter MFP subunit